MKTKMLLIMGATWACCLSTFALDHKGITSPVCSADGFTLIESGMPTSILCDSTDNSAVTIAVGNLSEDFGRVCGKNATVCYAPGAGKRLLIVGSLESRCIQQLIKQKKLDAKELQGKYEKYLLTTVTTPFEGVDEALVIAGSDRRGTVYGIYELSEQIGVSPWYWWADVPVTPAQNLSIRRGTYTAGEPAVHYRGIFLNDEAPCLTGWVKNHYGTDFGDHRFYADVFELILRLRGNFLWPAMWGWAFYADDPLNSKTANEMGVVVSTSHHEPMARNHQEWARNRRQNGAWNYDTNQKTLDRFFSEGIERMKGTEDVVTIGMRGDGDEPMSKTANLDLLRRIIDNQRQIIRKVTGQKPEKTPQVWALYKEVQEYYDQGLRVPDDVTILLADDNWGNVRRLPNAEERKRKGGWGLYYHVDYVGAPRNSKWLNVTPIANMWEQLDLTYEYGVDRLWVLNVGDLKPMEYPITLFLDVAWNPSRFNAENLMEHPRAFCAQQFGEEEAEEAARILNLYSKYNGRVTPEMLDARTYNLATGEWQQVTDAYLRLEAEAMRQFMRLPEERRDAYRQLILFPVQAVANLYDLYYSQAMNGQLFAQGDARCNEWADRVEKTFARDAVLGKEYNEVMAGGKWNGMMTQKHIGYRSWNDNFPRDIQPTVQRMDSAAAARQGGYTFTAANGQVVMEAEHFYATTTGNDKVQWTVIPDLGRTLSGITLMPRRMPVEGSALQYRMNLPADVKEVKAHVVVRSTLSFHDADGHAWTVSMDKGQEQSVTFNDDLNEKGSNMYSRFYPTVARRVVEKTVTLPVQPAEGNWHTLTLQPLDPGIVFEKIVVDCGGYVPSYLFGQESPFQRDNE